MSHPKNIGPGGCVPWDDFATWIRRVDIVLKAANSAANQIDAPAPMARPLWTTLDQLRDEVDAAMVVCGVERVAPPLPTIQRGPEAPDA